jgi:hypothetical protein
VHFSFGIGNPGRGRFVFDPQAILFGNQNKVVKKSSLGEIKNFSSKRIGFISHLFMD